MGDVLYRTHRDKTNDSRVWCFKHRLIDELISGLGYRAEIENVQHLPVARSIRSVLRAANRSQKPTLRLATSTPPVVKFRSKENSTDSEEEEEEKTKAKSNKPATFLSSEDSASALSYEFDDVPEDSPKQKKTPEDEESDNPENLKLCFDPNQPRREFKYVKEAEAVRRYRKHQPDTSKPYPKKKADEVYIIFGDENCRRIRQTLKEFRAATDADSDHK